MAAPTSLIPITTLGTAPACHGNYHFHIGKCPIYGSKQFFDSTGANWSNKCLFKAWYALETIYMYKTLEN